MTQPGPDVDPTGVFVAVPTLDDVALETRLLENAAPVLLYFTATWCGPCRVFGPRLDAYAANHTDVVAIVRVDCDESPGMVSRFGVQAFPTLVLVVDEEAVWLRAGALEQDELEALLPSVVNAARVMEPRTYNEDAPTTGTAAAARTTAVPSCDDPRVSIWNGRERVAAGADVELQSEEALRVMIRSDPRKDPACDTSVLRRFEPGAVDAISLIGSSLGEQHMRDLAQISGLEALEITAARPLDEGVVRGLPLLSDLRFLVLDAPQTDLNAVRRLLPAVMVNYDWTSPRLSAHLDPTAGSTPQPVHPQLEAGSARHPDGELAHVALADACSDTLIILVDQPSAPASDDVRRAMERVTDVATAAVVDGQDPQVVRRFELQAASELLLLHAGGVAARRDTCGPHHVAELVAIAAKLQSVSTLTDSVAPEAVMDQARVLALDLPDGAAAELVPPAAARADRVPLSPTDPHVDVPALWRLAAHALSSQLTTLPSDEIDVLHVQVDGGADDLRTLAMWPRLAELTVVVPSWDAEVARRLSEVVGLRRLSVYGGWSDAENPEEALRRALSWTVVNQDWTHPSLVDPAGEIDGSVGPSYKTTTEG